MSGLAAENEFELARRIAMSAYQAFRYAMQNKGPRGQELPAWEFLPDEAKDGWFRAVFVVKVETEDVQGKPWVAIAQAAYGVYAKAVGAGSAPWKDLPPQQKVGWEAATRHILALFESEDLTEEEVDKLESKWITWAIQREQKNE